MGMDLIGINPSKKVGRYFRNNCWWWRPLWSYVSEVACPKMLTEHQKMMGHYNDGEKIDSLQSKQIAKELKRLAKDGVVKQFEIERGKSIDALEDVPCDLCKGKGVRDDSFVKGKCNGCEGKGTKRPWEAHYPFEESNVLAFAEFCQYSGGFEIC